MSTPQDGLLHGPGTYCAIAVWRARPATAAARVADLAAAFARSSYEDASFVVGVDPARLPSDHPAAIAPMLPRVGPDGRFPSTQGSLVLQVAAEDRLAVTRVLRDAASRWSPWADLDEEVLGGRLGDGQEPFGYADAARPDPELARRVACIADGPAAGGSFLLYVRLVQDVAAFSALPAIARNGAFGMRPDGARLRDPAPNAHTRLMRQDTRGDPRLVRRGFPWRNRGDEGLCFVGASARPESFAWALDRMLGNTASEPDRLLQWCAPVSGGIYFVPPT